MPTGVDRHNPHLDSRLFGEKRKNMLEQARVLRRGGRLHDDELILGNCQTADDRDKQRSAKNSAENQSSIDLRH
jgi:hypothetical protein